MSKTMRGSFFLGDKKFEVKETEIPELKSNEVLVKNAVCGVCGTDVHIFHGEPGSADVNPPVVLGHEYSGEIVEVGSEVTDIKLGDHVTIDPNIYCGKCEYCRNGKKQLCESMQAIGVTQNGGFAEYSVIPASQAFVLNDDVSFEDAAMAEPIACCLHGIDLAEIKVGDKVCVVGGGAIGLIMVQLAKLSGASTIVLSEPNEKRRNAGLELGADYVINPLDSNAYDDFAAVMGAGADVVIECVGNNPAVDSAFKFANKGAMIMLFSVPQVDAKYNLNMFDIFKKELTIRGSFVNPDTHQRAVEMLNSGKLNMKPIVTHSFNLNELEDAIKMQMSDESIKVVVKAE